MKYVVVWVLVLSRTEYFWRLRSRNYEGSPASVIGWHWTETLRHLHGSTGIDGLADIWFGVDGVDVF